MEYASDIEFFDRIIFGLSRTRPVRITLFLGAIKGCVLCKDNIQVHVIVSFLMRVYPLFGKCVDTGRVAEGHMRVDEESFRAKAFTFLRENQCFRLNFGDLLNRC